MHENNMKLILLLLIWFWSKWLQNMYVWIMNDNWLASYLECSEQCARTILFFHRFYSHSYLNRKISPAILRGQWSIQIIRRSWYWFGINPDKHLWAWRACSQHYYTHCHQAWFSLCQRPSNNQRFQDGQWWKKEELVCNAVW